MRAPVSTLGCGSRLCLRRHFAASSATGAVVSFPLPAGVSQFTPYCRCSVHGTWVGDAYVVESAPPAPPALPPAFPTNAVWQANASAWKSDPLGIHDENYTVGVFGEPAAWGPTVRAWHVPVISVVGNMVTLAVGAQV